MHRSTLRALLLPLVLAPLAGCRVTRTLADPCVEIRTEGGHELGVSTDYGVVFLGRTGRAGDLEITAWYGDGPSVERTAVEPIAEGLCTAETEIRLPTVPLCFVEPAEGDRVLLAGRDAHGRWEQWTRVRSDLRVDGILLALPRRLKDRPDQVGAGVYHCPDGDSKRRELLGLVSGRIRLEGPSGTREYVTVVGPRDLWRLVTHRQDRGRPGDWVYREDIL